MLKPVNIASSVRKMLSTCFCTSLYFSTLVGFSFAAIVIEFYGALCAIVGQNWLTDFKHHDITLFMPFSLSRVALRGSKGYSRSAFSEMKCQRYCAFQSV